MNARLEALTGLSLADPELLLLALLVPLALLLGARRGPPALLFAPAPFLAELERELPTWRTRLALLPRALWVLGSLAALFALARPVERVPLPREVLGLDIVLCLDVSSSMAARDLDPARTRLAVAKEAAQRFVDARPDDRIGILGFARYPDVIAPPTTDRRALRDLLGGIELVERDGPEDATGIGTALARAAQLLASSTAASKVAILFTDGEENVASALTPAEIAPLHAAQLCRELGVRVYGIVAGAPDPAGAPLDTRELRQVAEAAGGAFFQVGDAAALASVFAAIDALEKAPLAEPRYRIEERFAPFLLAALALLLASRILGARFLEVAP